MAPVFAAKIWPSWSAPMDFGFSWRGERVLGDHKTLRGLAFGTVVAGLVFILQCQIVRYGAVSFLGDRIFPGDDSALLVGFWLGFCVLAADAFKSFFKRRWRVRPGGRWMPFDQVDWVFGAWLGASPFHRFGPLEVAILFGLGFAFSAASHLIGYLLRVNPEPF